MDTNINIPPTGENNQETMREEAINAYKKFIEQGITNPDVLGTGDPDHINTKGNPEVKEANELYYKWIKQIDSEAGDNEDLILRARLAKSMFYIDAGFTDPDYLDEVLNEWLSQDAQYATKKKDSLERKETRKMYADAMKKVRKLLRQE